MTPDESTFWFDCRNDGRPHGAGRSRYAVSSMDSALALVYMRTDLSGPELTLDECRMRRLAVRFGYRVCEVLRVDKARPQRLVLLEDRIGVHNAEAVFVPTADHLDGQLGRIVAHADVIEQNGETYARWSPIAHILGDSLLKRFAAPDFCPYAGAASDQHSMPC